MTSRLRVPLTAMVIFSLKEILPPNLNVLARSYLDTLKEKKMHMESELTLLLMSSCLPKRILYSHYTPRLLLLVHICVVPRVLGL